MKKITVVTPTYNRAHTLEKCYESLKTQTNQSFIWMIVDDGSIDYTEELVAHWIKDNNIAIKYIKKNNGGKASALNLALEKVKTDYFVCLDSDDTFTPIAIETALSVLALVEANYNICGVLALRHNKDGKVMGNKEIPSNIKETTIMEITDRFNIRSEFIQFYKTSVISKYRYPEINGEKFISSEYISREINRDYRFKVVHNHLCTSDYLDDGLTVNKIEIIKNNPKGYTLVKKQQYELARSAIAKIKHGIMFIAGSLLSKDKINISKPFNKVLLYILYPLGWLAYKIKFT